MSTPTHDYGEPWEISGDTDDEEWIAATNWTKDAGDIICSPPVDAEISVGHWKARSERIITCVNACAGIPDPAAEIARLRADLDSFDAIDKERNDALKTCMGLLEVMHFNRRIFKVDAYTKEIEAAMAQIKTCYDPHA